MTAPGIPDAGARELAHDFNNLLTAIIGAADAVLERSGIDPETRADVSHIREGARRGAALARSSTPRTREPPEPPGVISINETIRSTSGLLAHRLGDRISLVLSLSDCDAQVRIDAAQLDRMLLNLVSNARHAVPEWGRVTLTTGRAVMATAQPRVPDTIPPGDYVTISVADNGSGIRETDLARIFEPGFTSRVEAGGSGIGLTSVREIARGVGGFLAVESEEGRGTRFDIYLPRWNASRPPAEEPRPIEEERTVLLVEDDHLVCQVAERVLHRAGWTVLCADCAEVALRILNANSCDLLISDVAMPGMDGVALARHVQATWPALPIILTSGYERAATEVGIEAMNFVFLAKPYGQEDLLGAVARIADEKLANPARQDAGLG